MDAYLNQYMNWLDAEFAAWNDDSEAERVARTLSEIDRLRLKQRDATGDELDYIRTTVEALEASIADFAF